MIILLIDKKPKVASPQPILLRFMVMKEIATLIMRRTVQSCVKWDSISRLVFLYKVIWLFRPPIYQWRLIDLRESIVDSWLVLFTDWSEMVALDLGVLVDMTWPVLLGCVNVDLNVVLSGLIPFAGATLVAYVSQLLEHHLSNVLPHHFFWWWLILKIVDLVSWIIDGCFVVTTE